MKTMQVTDNMKKFKAKAQVELIKIIFESSLLDNAMPKRTKDILALYLTSGLTLEEVGKDFGMSGDDVWIIKDQYLPVIKTALTDYISRIEKIVEENMQLKGQIAFDKITKKLSDLEQKEILIGFKELKVFALPIESLDLSYRAFHGLKKQNINTVGELLERTPNELLSFKNFGVYSLREITSELKKLKLTMKSDPDEDDE